MVHLRSYRCNIFNSTSPSYTTITVPKKLVLCDYQPGDLVICEVRASTDVGYGPSANNKTSVYCGVPGKAVVQETQIVVYNNKEMRELINMNFTWKPVIPNCRGIANYSISLFYHNQLLKTQINEADKRDFSVESLYPYTNYTLLISTTNDEGFSSDFSYPIYTQETAPTDSPYLTLEFSSSCVELTIGSPRLPNGLILTYTYGCQDIQQQPRNFTYFTLGASNITRDSFPKVCGFMPASKINCSVYASNTAGDSPTDNVTGYTQLQLADASIMRTEHLVAFSTVSKGFSHTSILLKPVDLMNVPRNESYYQLIVQAPGELTGKRKKRYALFENSTCDSDSLYGHGTATELGMTCYITAEIPGSLVIDDGLTVNIGDGQTLNNYYNAPLEPEANYSLAVGLVVYPEEGQSITYYMKPVQFHSPRKSDTSETMEPKNNSLSIGLSVGVTIFVAVVIGLVLLYFIKLRQSTENNQSSATQDINLREVEAHQDGAAYATVSTDQDDAHQYAVCQPSGAYEELSLYDDDKSQYTDLSPVYEDFTSEKEIQSGDIPCSLLTQFIENNQTVISQQFESLRCSENSDVVLVRLKNGFDQDQANKSYASYIDATLLRGIDKDTAYIASQDPTEATSRDFWRMIWQEKTMNIVTIVNDVQKVPSLPYCPETIGSAMNCQCLKIVLLARDQKSRQVVRTLKVQKSVQTHPGVTVQMGAIIPIKSFRDWPQKIYLQEKETLAVKQFEFHSWDDLSSPAEINSFVEFVRKVRIFKLCGSGPILVYSSNQEEKSGIFIGLSILLDEAKQRGTVNVTDCVKRFRERRPQLISSEIEYTLLYKVLEEALKCETFLCEKKYLERKLKTDMDSVLKEYQSYKRKDQFLTVSLSEEHQPEIFWKMVVSEDIQIIVLLDSEMSMDRFHPHLDGTSILFDDVVVERSLSESNELIKWMNLCVNGKPVFLVVVNVWADGESNGQPDYSSLLYYLTVVESQVQGDTEGKICLMESKMLKKTAMFVAAYNAIEKIKAEQVVDVYGAVLVAWNSDAIFTFTVLQTSASRCNKSTNIINSSMCSNYATWKFKIKHQLIAKELFGYIDETTVAPASTADGAVKATYNMNSSKPLSHIVLAVVDELLYLITECEMAKEV
ncbi:receptor-type tyrosine-protein phosphatase T-like [Watersipora subatra]|uniref:receptor-type tyrosine-protein phosphatase T-like n=1 Tax=Watersipora subatra TaxID=2589382 RepID=UPI00355C0BB6